MSENELRIVVGVDGSPGSRAALRWALRYAEQCGGAVTAVIAWSPPTFTEVAPMPPVLSDEDSVARAEWELRKAVDETRASLETSVPVRQEVARGHAVRALLDCAQDADLLVVGSRGHGGFVGALLGSVSLHCVTHAHCPVVVVRPAAG
ncbi:universal stress protein [Saccharopolyspora phatthalungensis]|uniref:Nucleotide-binding universal stress UspA family protein n=1 Tax=Saccharopolyspora phatthalungensis TaxID=664693 RepID=A0A840QGB7_9PSEU|nr:universal stress protein [Saccharopolyspora phatthalungensis]MBB5157565.1 nucleotide-binding universal stress UspA family protein [Saccharopolyspora phatthalungensis]